MKRIHFRNYQILLILLMLAGIWLRYANLLQQPNGLHEGEIADLRIVKSIQQGDIRVFYPLESNVGRESLYHGIVAPFQNIWQHPTISFHVIAVWSFLISISLLFLFVKRFYGHLAGIIAASIWSFNFVTVLFSRNIGRESITAIPVILVLLILSETNRHTESGKSHGDMSRIKYFFLSVSLGFCLYLHPIAISLLLGSLLFILINFRYHLKRIRKNWLYLLFSLMLLFIIALPYVISAIQNPDLAGIARWLPSEDEDGQGFVEYSNVVQNLLGLFVQGDSDATVNIPGEPLLEPFISIFIITGILYCVRNWREFTVQLVCIVGVILLLPAIFLNQGPDFQSFALVLPILPILGGIGVQVSYRWIHRLGVDQEALRIVFVLVVIGLFWMTNDRVFRRWPASEGWDEIYHHEIQILANYLDKSAEDLPTVFCGVPSISAPQRLNQVDLMQLMLIKDDLPIRYVDCNQGLVLIGGGLHQQYVLTDPNALESSPDWFIGLLDEYSEKQMIGSELGYPINDQVIQFDVIEPLATLLGNYTTTRPLRYPRDQENTVAPSVRYGGNLTFLGYDFITAGPYFPGEIIPIDLFWRIDGSVPKDIRIYLHLVFHEGDLANITAQVDSVSVFPESLRARDIWLHRAQLELPTTMPPGEYLLLLGAYTNQTGDRMPVYDKGEGSHIRGDYLLLPDITVMATEETSE